MAMQNKLAWVRAGLNGKIIRSGDLRGWRCFFGDDEKEILVKAIVPKGQIDGNLGTGTTAAPNPQILVGWFWFFGSCTIEDDVLYITLQTPTAPPPSSYNVEVL